MKTITNSYPLWREGKIINTTDPEKLGRIQLKVYPELSDIPDADCPWCFPHTGGVHGKSFGVPLIDQLVTCVVWSRYFNEITFLPFNITKPTEHLFDDWMKNQRSEVADMETDPEEEHLIVDQYEDDFSVFHDTKNGQHGFLHPTGTYGVISKDGSVYIRSVKNYTFHNDVSDLFVELNSKSGDITLKTKGKQTTKVAGDISVTGDANWKVTATKNAEIKTENNGNVIINAGKKVKIHNSSQNLGAIVSDGFQAVHDAITLGSPTTQAMNPVTKAALQLIIKRCDMLMEK